MRTWTLVSVTLWHFACTWVWCKTTAGQLHLNNNRSDTNGTVQYSESPRDVAWVDISRFIRDESVSNLPKGFCLCISRESERRWLLPSTALWQPEEPGGARDMRQPERSHCQYHNRQRLQLSFERWNLRSASGKWPWETMCWHTSTRTTEEKWVGCEKVWWLLIFRLSIYFIIVTYFFHRPLERPETLQYIAYKRESVRSIANVQWHDGKSNKYDSSIHITFP